MLKEYQKFCKQTAKGFPSANEEIFCWACGLTGEAGDVASCIKKTFAHDNDQREGIKENIGDTMWYLAMICNFFGWDMEEVVQQNMNKLKKRFPNGFTEKDAQRKSIDWNEK